MPNAHRYARRTKAQRPRPAASPTDGHLVGDKVGVKVTSHAGARGRVARVRGDTVVVALSNGEAIVLPFSAFTNYSRAARRAWKVMPKRAGRPRAEHPRKKMVSVRLDIELIDRLDIAARRGFVESIAQAVADGVTKHLDILGVPAGTKSAERRSDV